MASVESLLIEWLGNIGEKSGFPSSEKSLIAFDKINEIVESGADSAWVIIETGIEIYGDDEYRLGQIAAGPLEDALSFHGAVLIEWVEKKAQTNEALLKMLGMLYKFQMSDQVWKRVQRLLKND